MIPRSTWNSSCSVRGRYLCLRDRETWTPCSLQTATRTHCSEFVEWSLEHKDQWRENTGDLFLQKNLSPWRRTITRRTRHSLCKNVTYLGVTFDRRMTWRHHVERTAAKALRTYVRTSSLLRSGRLITNTKLTLYKALIMSVILMLVPLCSTRRTLTSWNCGACRTEYSALLEILTSAYQSVNCTWLPKYFTCLTA
jgi:hypothetical protein